VSLSVDYYGNQFINHFSFETNRLLRIASIALQLQVTAHQFLGLGLKFNPTQPNEKPMKMSPERTSRAVYTNQTILDMVKPIETVTIKSI